MDQLLSALPHILFGGCAANVILIMGLINVAMGSEGSKVSRERRLPIDSDAGIFVIFFVVGAICGTGVAVMTGLTHDWSLLIVTGFVSFFATLFIGLMLTSKINDSYVRRARQNLKDGLYEEAIEDASEVARSSDRLGSEARAIEKLAREMREDQTLEIPQQANYQQPIYSS